MATHNYWRLNIAGTDGGTTLTLAEIELRSSVGGANIAVGPAAITGTSDTNFGGSYLAGNAFDGNALTSPWGSSSASLPHWLRASYGSAQTILSYAITADTSYYPYHPKTWTLEYSTNAGSSWSVAHTVTNESAWTPGLRRIYTLPSSVGAAADWRLNISDSTSPPYAFVGEWELSTTNPFSQPYSASSGVPSNAFDGSTSTNWALTAGTVGWINFYFVTAVDIIEHAVTAPSSSTTNAPNRWTLQYSDDAVLWTTAAIIGGQTGWTASEQRVFTHSSYPLAIGRASLLPTYLQGVTVALAPASTHATLRTDPALQTSAMISGTVKQSSTAVARTVRAYCRLTGELLGETVSNASTGAFALNARGKEDHCYVVALDDLGAGVDYNAQIFDLIIPV